MSEGRGQSVQPSERRLETLPDQPANYGELHIVFDLNKKCYRSLDSNEASERFEDYANICLSFLTVVHNFSSKWKVNARAVDDIISLKNDLDTLFADYLKALKRARRIGTRDPSLSQKKMCVERCLGDTEEIAEELLKELDKTFLDTVKSHELTKEKTLRTGFGPEAVFSSPQPGRPETIDPALCRQLKEAWIKCYTTAELCNKVILKLHKSDEEFAKKSLREIHGEIIAGLCDELESCLSLLKMSRSDVIQQLVRNLPALTNVLEEANKLRSYVNDVDVKNLYDCFNRMWNHLLTMRFLTFMFPG